MSYLTRKASLLATLRSKRARANDPMSAHDSRAFDLTSGVMEKRGAPGLAFISA